MRLNNKMLINFITVASILFLIFAQLPGCSNTSNHASKIVQRKNNDYKWIEDTYSFIDSTFTESSNMGGYYNALKVNEFIKTHDFDINSSLWYLKSLHQINGKKVVLKQEENKEIQKRLKRVWNEGAGNYPEIYFYWVILSIYKELKIDVPIYIEEETVKLLKTRINNKGFYEDENGSINNILTIISIRASKLVNYDLKINENYLTTLIETSLEDENSNSLIEYLIMYIELGYKVKVNLKDKISEFFYHGWNWSEQRYLSIDYLYNYKLIVQELNLKNEIPPDVLVDFKQYFQVELANNFVDGSFIYQSLFILKNNIDVDAIREYILLSKNRSGLWRSSIYKFPDLKETYYALAFYKLNNIELEKKKINLIKNYYTESINKNSISITELPYLAGIGFWLKEKQVFVEPVKFDDKILLTTSEEKKLETYLILKETFNFYSKPDNAFITKLQTNIARKDNWDQEKMTLIQKLGLLLAKVEEGLSDKENIEPIIAKHWVNNKGYALNDKKRSADLISTYYTFFVQSLLRKSNDRLTTNLIENYKNNKGFVLYRGKEDWSNIQLTFYGFSLLKLRDGVNNENKD